MATPETASGLGLRAKLLLSYLAVITLAATTMIVIAEWTAPFFYRTHIEQMVQMFGIRDIPEMRRQLSEGFTGAFGSALIVASTVTLLVALVVSAFVSREILRSVKRVSHASTRIAAGHYAERLPEMGRDELGELTSSFNRMAEALEATEVRRRELIGTVAHELRTPLTGMRGLTEGLLDGVFLIEEAGPDLIREIRRLERLTQDLSLVTQAEAGVIPVVPRMLPLAELAGVACAQFQRAFTGKGLTLSLEVQRDVQVVADPDRVTQVLVNLLSNALRHTQHGGVTVQVDGSGRSGCLEVRDTGEGISTQDLPHVFERFYRSDQSRARDAEESIGAGVGLTVSRHLVEAMGGTIQVTSTEGVGSTFTVLLPQVLMGELVGRSQQVR
ncbi:sensor histidine kinase [Deinococcus humi]|uniref:histidine kinase n=1 Tax=Deinococcus humi TaxID=662880 RepID=A0A7W8NH30_9DEIO|nr:HAMP domain-containing sensor histidine kinase [Deinococcus humi]MBB5364408.1 histidine kinase [Deinococcus humi]GGO33225.1 two-component sensor histidine kinase [Deinococcus humi]